MVVQSTEFTKNNPLNETNVAIIVTSFEGHMPFLKYALSRYMETGKYIICSYDRHGESIPSDILNIPHAWTLKHPTYGAEKRNGWLWDIVYAAGIIQFSCFDYVVITNGDCVWDRPENIDKIIDLLGHNDLMSASSDTNLIHTCNAIFRDDVFLNFIEYVVSKLNRNIPQSYSPEVLLRDFVKIGRYRNKIIPKQPIYPKNHFYEGKIDHYSSYHQDSTWKDILGYRNLGGEHKAACQEHLESVPAKYFDLRDGGKFLNKHERDTLYFYLTSGDRRYLYKYWTEGEDSYWNRRYYDIEYFGEEPLHDDIKRKELGPPSERLGHFNRWIYNSFVLKDDEFHSKWKKIIEGK